jgi:hypothetical protein
MQDLRKVGIGASTILTIVALIWIWLSIDKLGKIAMFEEMMKRDVGYISESTREYGEKHDIVEKGAMGMTFAMYIESSKKQASEQIPKALVLLVISVIGGILVYRNVGVKKT